MQRHLLTGAICALIAMPLALSPARADDDPMKHLADNPNVGALVIYGAVSNKKIKDNAVQGGQAMEVKASGVGESYAAAAQTDIIKPIKAGDQIECDIFLKATRDDGQTPVIHARVQGNAAPYAAVGEDDFTVTDQWALYSLKVTADKNYDKNKLVFVVHLNGAKQTVDIGPAFVFNNSETY